MWLMTKHGFYSIVEKPQGEFQVRARERRDLQNLVDRVPLPTATIIDTPKGDYAARMVVSKETVLRIMEFLGNTVDYSNFKDRIDATSDQAHKPYHEIWGVLARVLGAYGRRGKPHS